MFRTGISNNGIIVINRGDNFSTQLYVNKNTAGSPEPYPFIQDKDKVYLSVCEPQQSFMEGIIRKEFDPSLDDDNNLIVNILLEPKDTINILPGTYYYEIKAKLFSRDDEEDFIIDTVVPKRKLVIL